MKQVYECQISFATSKPHKAERRVNEATGWHFSRIDGGAIFNSGEIECFATKEFDAEKIDADEAIKLVNQAALRLDDQDISILRRKIGLVIYDELTPLIGWH